MGWRSLGMDRTSFLTTMLYLAKQCLTETGSKNRVKEQVKLKAGKPKKIVQMKVERSEVEMKKSVEN